MTARAVADHPFAGQPMLGIDQPPNTPCAHAGCGAPRSEHEYSCTAWINIEGEHFPCDLVAPHDGWDHANKEAQAAWGEPPMEYDRTAMMLGLVPDKRTPEQRLDDATRTNGESLKYKYTPEPELYECDRCGGDATRLHQTDDGWVCDDCSPPTIVVELPE